MSGYPPSSSHTAAATGSNAAASTSASDDPYAPFYYWDATANNWAFDYNSYYATYGYPATYYSQDPSSAAAAPANPYYLDASNSYSQQASSASASASFSTPATTTTTNTKHDERYDEHGRRIPGKLQKGETRPTVLRRAAGKMWEDQTLLEWDPSHKRLFVGDLGNDVSDETLAAAFDKYPSFSKARVVRNKEGKGKGYGFVAFADPHDFLNAWKQMNGKYIGSRPCTLKKADESVKVVHIGARKDKLLAISSKHQSQSYKNKMGGPVGNRLSRIARAPYSK